MDEELLGCIVFFGFGSYVFFSMHKKDREQGQDNMDISYSRFKIKALIATMAFVSFFGIVFKIYKYIQH